MKNTVYCIETNRGTHNFFIELNNKDYFLFSQKYNEEIDKWFKNGISLPELLSIKKTRHNESLMHTISKFPSRFKYIEKEYQISIYDKKQKTPYKRHTNTYFIESGDYEHTYSQVI